MNPKDELRNIIHHKRAALTLGWIKENSDRIVEHIKSFPLFEESQVLAAYYAKAFEVQIAPLLESFLRKGGKVCVPRHRDDARGYDWSWVAPAEGWRDGPYRIAEPAKWRPVDIKEVEIALIPAMAVDRKGNRLGHGGGNVDRLLEGMDIPRIAVVFDFQVMDEVPIESHDVGVQYIASESGIYTVQA
jgi:5-formyltetrahydrofolate cyclo-ligase